MPLHESGSEPYGSPPAVQCLAWDGGLGCLADVVIRWRIEKEQDFASGNGCRTTVFYPVQLWDTAIEYMNEQGQRLPN